MTDYMYKYYKEEEKIKRIHIEQDINPWNPRTEQDGNVGIMMCWHQGYVLGDTDKNNYRDSEEFLQDLLRRNVNEKTILNYVRNGKASGIKIKYNRSDYVWELWTTYYMFPLEGPKDAKFQVYSEQLELDWLINDIIKSLSNKDIWYLLEKHANIIALPLYLYDHSGITMSTASFNDCWDSRQVGWIYTDKENVLFQCYKFRNSKGNLIKITKRNWKEAAYQKLKKEVKTYDMYLRGQVYGVVIEEYNSDCEDFDETDSCWGFYDNSYDEEEILLKLAPEMGVTEELYDTIEEVL